MMLTTFADYIGFSLLWSIPLLHLSKFLLCFKPTSHTSSGRPLPENYDLRLEEKIKEKFSSLHAHLNIQPPKIIETWNAKYLDTISFTSLKKPAVIIVIPGLDLIDHDAFVWLYHRELFHLISKDHLLIPLTRALSSLCAAFLLNITLGCSLFLSAFLTLTIGWAVHILLSYIANFSADRFAIQNSSIAELQGALRFLTSLQFNRKSLPFYKLWDYLFYVLRIKQIKHILKVKKHLNPIDLKPWTSLHQLIQKNDIEEQLFIESKKERVLKWIDADNED